MLATLSISRLHADEAWRNRHFPVTVEKAFFGHAAVCPLPRRVAEAMSQYALQSALGDQEAQLSTYHLPRTRYLAARLLQAQPEEIAFVGPTSLALNLVASGISFQKGENVVTYFDDYPSNVYPWLALQSQGIEIRLLEPRGLGQIEMPDLVEKLDSKTRLVALTSCHFLSGYKLNLTSIGKVLRERGILFCVDGIQTLGAFPTAVEYIDFLAADAHKWLLGPCAAGILYVRRAVQEQLRPPLFGWNNVRSPNFITEKDLTLRPGARRYEVGTHNLIGLVGLNAALELLLEVGIENIASELLRQRAWFIPELQRRGYQVLNSACHRENASGIITFHHPGQESGLLHESLAQEDIVTSLRVDRAGRAYVRVSPHFYNTDAELQKLLAVLDQFALLSRTQRLTRN